jgi:hypothetical protein
MSKKVKIKKRKKKVKERPFDDSDTVIQWREDFVQDYIREPLMRKAVEEPVVERVVTENMEKDILVEDEDTDIGVRTREKTLPSMPLELEFMQGMQNSVETTLLMDVKNCLRFYNDALRNPSAGEMAKVFLLGVIRQLRYWSQTQTPQTEVQEGTTALDWVITNLLPRINADMSILAKHFTPEIDKVYFRRWSLEMNILKQELQLRKDISDTARQEIVDDGFDPYDTNSIKQIVIPEENILVWIKEHPQEAEIVFADDEQFNSLISIAWSEVFNNDNNIEYLSLLDTLQLQSDMNLQQQSELQSLIERLIHGTTMDVSSMLGDDQYTNIFMEIQQSSSIIEQTNALKIIQALLSAHSGSAQDLSTKTLEDTTSFKQVLTNIGK